MSDIFVDRFMKFNVSQGVVRLDFARIEDIDSVKRHFGIAVDSIEGEDRAG